MARIFYCVGLTHLLTFMQGVALTAQDKQKFLQKLMSSAGNVSKAAQAVKIARHTAYEHKKNDPDFSQAWDNVLAAVYDQMEQELYNRAVKGWDEPVFYKGDMIAKIRKKSDRLLEFALKGNRAEKFRERLDLNAHHTGSLDVNIQATIDSVYGSDSTPGAGLDAGPDPDGEE